MEKAWEERAPETPAQGAEKSPEELIQNEFEKG